LVGLVPAGVIPSLPGLVAGNNQLAGRVTLAKGKSSMCGADCVALWQVSSMCEDV
jgi:hypothetical protein